MTFAYSTTDPNAPHYEPCNECPRGATCHRGGLHGSLKIGERNLPNLDWSRKGEAVVTLRNVIDGSGAHVVFSYRRWNSDPGAPVSGYDEEFTEHLLDHFRAYGYRIEDRRGKIVVQRKLF
ncbi:MAG TPA: hypothetical protein VGL77_02060 [Armatimonadota bacterium]|jgi:hypothetical protein